MSMHYSCLAASIPGDKCFFFYSFVTCVPKKNFDNAMFELFIVLVSSSIYMLLINKIW